MPQKRAAAKHEVNMRVFPRAGALLALLAFLVLGASGTWAKGSDIDKAKPNLPKELEAALTELFEAVPAGRADPDEHVVNMVLRFVVGTDSSTFLHPASRAHGVGVFYRDTIRQPLRVIAGYIVDPAVPAEAVYPATVRRGAWLPGGIASAGPALLKAAWPPAKPLMARGQEREETTPELSSGCYYSYALDRLFILTGMGGRTALMTVSVMPKASGVGLKGAIAGKDADWKYVYTEKKGTNLPMLSWAETYLYGSATLNIFIESAPGSRQTDVYTFKWAKAGWSGMNVVKPSHIMAGVKRYLGGLKTFMESSKRPQAAEIAAWSAELQRCSTDELQHMLSAFAADLEERAAHNEILSRPEFQAVLDNGGYAARLNRENAVAEILKLRVRKALGLSVPVVAHPVPARSETAARADEAGTAS